LTLIDSHPSRRSTLRNPLLYSSLAFAAVLLSVGWVFFSRWQENREIERRAKEKRATADRRMVEALGGDRFEILNFYASPGVIQRGGTSQLCYAVSNAKKVRLEPQSSPVWPSYGRCVDVSPARSTTYTLTAEDAAGHTKSETLVLRVK